MTSEKLKCVFCKDRNEKIITFVEDKLKKCKEVLQIRVNFKLKYDSVQLPEQVNDTDGYHRNCYNSFTALMAKYRKLSEKNVSPTVDLPSTSSSTSVFSTAVDVPCQILRLKIHKQKLIFKKLILLSQLLSLIVW